MPRDQRGDDHATGDGSARGNGGQPQNEQSAQQPAQQNQQRQNQHAQTRGGRRQGSGLRDYLATTAVRFGLAMIGVVLLLFSLGQAFGADLLGAFADALSTQTGQWLVVALFALFLIGAAERGLSYS
ncbi:hypothetical protein [Haloarchaeobius sp. DYHT-AS-18]|uniref:hypothetical protein n=1 Tax=Haloarchaeobius sp. DYHT-AS-18 TaxID=3446117 RepID=UPI003EB94271